MSLLFPTLLKNRITELTPQELETLGIKALLLDVDNTLTRHHSQELDDEVTAWLQGMREAGVQMRLVSNSKKPRVDPFAKRIGLDYEHTSMKPLPFGFHRAAKAMGVSRRECLAIGDQTFTDVLGAKLAGVRVLQLLPIEAEPMWSFRVRRRLEKRVLARYQRRQQI